MRTRRSLVREIERHKAAIGKHRDALVKILANLTATVDSIDDGCEDLEIAIQTLSQYIHFSAPRKSNQNKKRSSPDKVFASAISTNGLDNR